MKRWNGWGDENIKYPIPGIAKEYMQKRLGEFQDIPDAALSNVLKSVPESKLTKIKFVTTDPFERVIHSCGQSLPDWIHLRAGRIPRFTDGIFYPKTDDDVQSVMEFANENDVQLIPYGGGTSVVGHINPVVSDNPVLTLDLSHLDRLLEFNENNQIANFQAGIRGPDIESALNKIGYTLGHFPQSFEYSTLGGWIASRSCGQQSLYYGRIEDIFQGGTILTPMGKIVLQPFPASAAGPDLRQVFLGSEGRFGVVTQASVQVHPLPEYEAFFGVFFRTWEDGVNATREIAQKGIQLSMLRLSDPQETETTLVLSGKESLLQWADVGLTLLGFRDQRCMLIFGLTGNRKRCSQIKNRAMRIFHKHGGRYTGTFIGKSWQKNRFKAPYLRNSLWEAGFALDTLETAVTWEKVSATKSSIINAISNTANKRRLPILVFGHISHIYPSGASIYITYIFKRSSAFEENLDHWRNIKESASQTIISQGGTISHQHGIGLDHARYLEQEKGSLGTKFLKDAMLSLDPKGIMNPHVMLVKSDQNVIR
jgi:alkyldihydroxyacetonephosphate synthase